MRAAAPGAAAQPAAAQPAAATARVVHARVRDDHGAGELGGVLPILLADGEIWLFDNGLWWDAPTDED